MLFTFGANSWLLQQPSQGLLPPPWQARFSGRRGGRGASWAGSSGATCAWAEHTCAGPGGDGPVPAPFVAARWTEPGRSTREHPLPKMGMGWGPLGQAGGRPRSHGPSQLTPASDVSWAAPPTQQPQGSQEARGQRPAALPREAGTEGGLWSGQSPARDCVAAGQRCPSLGL